MRFEGYRKPYTTPVPDEFFDRVLAEIDNLAELKVVLYALRRTFGFGKLVDRISYSQFLHGIKTGKGETAVQLDRGTGLSLSAFTDGLKKALDHGYLVRYVVCPNCDREVSELEEEERQGSKIKVAPERCPHCPAYLGRRAHFYYAIPLLSTQLSTLPRETEYPYYKSFSRGTSEFLVALLRLSGIQETDKQETGKQETVRQETDNNKQAVAVVTDLLYAFGFRWAESQAIAEEALKAELTEEDVEAWIEYVRQQGSLTNPRGFLRARLRSGKEPPDEEDDRYRYIRGKYADYIKY